MLEQSASDALVFGTGIHTAIEEHSRVRLAGEPRRGIDELLLAYRSAWLPQAPDAIQFGAKETRETPADLAARMFARLSPGV